MLLLSFTKVECAEQHFFRPLIGVSFGDIGFIAFAIVIILPAFWPGLDLLSRSVVVCIL